MVIDRYSGMVGYGMEPTDIDPVLMQDSFQMAQAENSAREMLSRGATMEDVVQATGLGRQTVENIYMKDQVMGAPSNPMPNPVAPGVNLTQDVANMGIMGNASNDETTQMIIDSMTSGEGEGADIKEFLDISLGANKGEDDDLTVGQALEAGSLAGSKGNQGSFSSYLDSASMLEDMTDPEKLAVYKQAAANMVGELDYESLIEQPDKVMPYLAAGLSLINSGEKGEDWGAALGKAFISGKMSSKKEESAYKKTKAGLELKKQSDINNLVTNMALTDVKDRMAMNTAIRKQKYTDDSTIKMYDIAGSEGFADKQTLPLSATDFKKFVQLYPEGIRPTEDQKLNPFTIYTDTDKIMNIYLDEDQLGYYQQNGYAGQIRDGHEDRNNSSLYQIKELDGTKTEKYLTKDEFNALPSGTADLMPTSGSAIYVRRKDNGKTDAISPMEFMRNGNLYDKISAWSGTVTMPDGTTMEMGNGQDGSRAVETRGLKQYNTVNDKLQGIDRAVENYFTSADQMDKVINEYVTEFPEQADLAFNNLAGKATKLADNIVISVKGFGALLNTAPKDGGSTFYVGDSKVSYEDYKTSIMGSSEFETFRNSPFATFLEQSGITGARLDAALFDMSMIGAGSYSIDKGLDLRAISDFETKQFMKLQGSEAASLAQFLAITNDFRVKLVNRNINEINLALEPSNLFQIKKRDGSPDFDAQEALKKSGELKLDKLLKRKEELENIDTSSRPAGNKTFVVDPSMDPGNVDVVEFKTITANPESQFGQQYGLTTPLTTETQTEFEGTYREMLNKYSALKGDVQQEDAYIDQLQKTLSPPEFAFFQAHIMQAQKLGL